MDEGNKWVAFVSNLIYWLVYVFGQRQWRLFGTWIVALLVISIFKCGSSSLVLLDRVDYG